MKYVLLIIVILGLLCLSCEKQEVRFRDLVSKVKFEKNALIADGVDSMRVTVDFDPEAVLENISASAVLSNGVFLKTKTNTITITPQRFSNNVIRADFMIKSNTKFRPYVLDLNVNQFIRRDSIESIRSVASQIALTISPFSAFNSFRSEISLEVSLKNENGQKVSEGTQVQFLDYLEDGTSAGGRFRIINGSSNLESKVQAVYSPGIVTPNQNVIIEAQVLDADGVVTSISDKKEVFINSD